MDVITGTADKVASVARMSKRSAIAVRPAKLFFDNRTNGWPHFPRVIQIAKRSPDRYNCPPVV